jgi:hypothetical protein
MKLVIEFYECDEECNSTITIPVEYESAEALICDFTDCVRAAVKNKIHSFTFCGEEFYAAFFYFYNEHGVYHEDPPNVYTLDEWFDKKKIMKEI